MLLGRVLAISFLLVFQLLGNAELCADGEKQACGCAEARLQNGWCDSCAVGYVAGFPMRCPMLWETLDAHGHDIDPKSMECGECQAALATDGFCKKHRWGFIRKQLYYSRLTYLLGLGTVTEKVDCEQCRVPESGHVWCSKCSRGFVGNVAYTDRKLYDAALPELTRLRRSIDLLKKCRYCAVALFLDSRCIKCRIEYRDAQAAPGKDRAPAKKRSGASKPREKQPGDDTKSGGGEKLGGSG